MFVDGTYLFLSNRDIKQLFLTVNEELTHFQTWFNSNKLSLNIGKTKYSLFPLTHLLMQIDFLYVYQNWSLTIQLLREKIQ